MDPIVTGIRFYHSPTMRFTTSLWRHLWATLLLCALCTTAQAAPKRVALLIGNSQYQHESSLANPVRDVRLLAQSLRGLGFKVEVLENLPKREMDLAIKRFVRDSAEADTALLYYAGHGQQPSKGGRSFLLPVNANAVDDDQLEADGVPAEDIAAQLERLPNPARLRLVVLDACRNTRAVNRSTVRGLAPPARTDSFTLIAYSTDANAVAQDGTGQNSPYAQALAKHLPGLASKPVRQVFEDTAREVRQATRQQQWPRTYGDLESRIGLDGVEIASTGPKPPQTTNQVAPATDERLAFLKRLSSNGDASATMQLADGHFFGVFGRSSAADARPLYERLAKAGNLEAQAMVQVGDFLRWGAYSHFLVLERPSYDGISSTNSALVHGSDRERGRIERQRQIATLERLENLCRAGSGYAAPLYLLLLDRNFDSFRATEDDGNLPDCIVQAMASRRGSGHWLYQAAMGLAAEHNSLVFRRAHGKVEIDAARLKALEYFRSAASNGGLLAAQVLALSAATGRFGAYPDAVKAWHRLAGVGDERSQYMLYNLVYGDIGGGVKPDWDKACYWLNESIKGGDERPIKNAIDSNLYPYSIGRCMKEYPDARVQEILSAYRQSGYSGVTSLLRR